MMPLAINWTGIMPLLGAAVVGVMLGALLARIGLRRMKLAHRDMDRELGRAQAATEHLHERLDDARDHLHAREQELRSLSSRHQQLQQQYVELQTVHNEKMAHFSDMQRALDQAHGQMKLEFQNLANHILDEKSRVFSSASQTALDALLRPFREQVEGFQKRVNQIHDETLRGNASLGTEIRRVADLGMQISAEASGLTAALRGDKKTLGNWGELQLERTLQLAGLVKDEHYAVQPRYQDGQNQRRHPDFVIHLPDNKHIVIDSKVSLVDYERAVLAENEDDQKQARDAHVRAVRQHVDDLAGKDYSNLAGMESPSFVLMYMPVEAAYIEVLRHTHELYDYAYRRNVVLVSPTTVLPVLKTVANVWMVVRSNEQAHQLSERAGEIYNQVALMAERLKRLGGTLGTASGHYNDVVTAVAGQQGLFGKVSRFGELSSRANRVLPELDPLNADFDNARLIADGPDTLPDQNMGQQQGNMGRQQGTVE